MQQHDNYIGGQWLKGSAYASNINPSNLADLIGMYAQGDAEQVAAAVSAASTAYPAWAQGSVQTRSEVLDRIGSDLVARREELGALLGREEGKTCSEGIAEVMRAGQIFKFFAGECLRLAGETLPSVRSGINVEISREPIGVVGIIAPWNFPIAIPAWKIAPALAFGNCVVFKPADLVPGSAWALAEIISRSGIPAGVFNLVMGRGSVIGDAIVNHPDVHAVSFTGSTGVGGQIADLCVKSKKRVQIEMGGKNPQVVLDDADLQQAVEVCIQSAFYSTGQRCTAASRLIVTQHIYPEFIAAMKERMSRITVGNALVASTDIGPVASLSQLEQDLKYIAIGQQEGARLIGGQRLQVGTEGYYLSPALFTECAPEMRICREEIFGPVAAVIKVKDYDEALQVANDTEFGLSAGIATASLKYATHFKRHSQAGMVMVNLPTAGVDYHVPFGGRKASSYGPREQGTYAREFFTVVKTAYTQA
jgi:acyl-CoA reductase-like NAD-dependent aldehyde dehydrogenase